MEPRARPLPAVTTPSSAAPSAARARSPSAGDKGHDGAFGVGHNRAVQALSFNSHEIATQPYLKVAQLAALKAEKLAFDIFQDVLSVVKVANFPALLAAGNKITKSFDQFSSDDLADLKVLCKAWPMEGRGLMIDSAYDGNLMKDPTFKAAYQQAFDSVKTLGHLPPQLYSFGYMEKSEHPRQRHQPARPGVLEIRHPLRLRPGAALGGSAPRRHHVGIGHR